MFAACLCLDMVHTSLSITDVSSLLQVLNNSDSSRNSSSSYSSSSKQVKKVLLVKAHSQVMLPGAPQIAQGSLKIKPHRWDFISGYYSLLKD